MTENFYSYNSYDWQTNTDELFRTAWNLLFAKVQKIIGDINGKLLLDAGCGKGDFYPYVSNSNYHGIDISEDNIVYAKKRRNSNSFSVCDILKTGFKDNYFDALVSIEVIEHLTIEDIKKFLNEIRRITKKSAKIVITTPNLYYLWGIIPWSFFPIRRRLTMGKFIKGIKNGYVDENYNLPVWHYRFKPSFLQELISNYLRVNSMDSTYWYNNRAIHGIAPEFQLKLLKFSDKLKTNKILMGQQLVIECENIK